MIHHSIKKNITRKDMVVTLVAYSFLTIRLFTQNYPSFINMSCNKIYYDKDSTNFYKFKNKLQEFTKGKRHNIHIVHFGGSHVQGGFWSESIMTSLQTKANTNGGGYFVFPFRQVKTNTPYYFKTYSNGKWKVNKCTKITDTLKYIGMCGISAITDTSCYISIKNNWDKLSAFTNIKFFHRFNQDYEIIPQFKTNLVQHHDYYSEYFLAEPTDSIAFQINKKENSYSEFILDGISCENINGGVYYAGFGVNGATSESFLNCALLLHQLKNMKVDLFILSFGVNDVRNKSFEKAEYFNNYDTLIKILKTSHPEASILITTISDNYIKRKGFNKRTELGNQAIFEIMKKHQIAVWDLYSVMGGYKSMYKWYKAGWSAKDKIHFNKKGYTLLGQLMTEAFFLPLQFYPKK
ncbi:MAG: GDSL-type esterase/lipase family protein [Bacteroidia bacterium]|nr:GDSL-type esterase/lipase family protein [Bacteroidia bacterium]